MSIEKRVRKMSNRNIPKIRFKEFINKWNNYKLGQLGNFKSGIGFPDSQQGGTEGIPFFKVSDMNNIGNETEMRNANNYVTQEQIMKNSWKVINETPAIIFAKVGAALMLNRKRLVTKPFLIDNNTMSYSFDESWDKDFGLTLFQTINLPKYAQIGALPSYNASDIAMIKVNVPNVQEQSAIGSLFRTLDDLLSSYKDNLANYQALKTTMLSKMFPKAGQRVPEIRLDGFEGEWEEKKLGEIVNIVGGGTPDTNVKEYWNGEINWFSPTEVGNSIYLDTSEKRISELGLQKSSAKILPANRTILFTSRAGIGSVGIITKDSTTNQGFQSLVTKKGIDIYFLFSYSSEITRYALKHSAGSTFLEISGKELGKMDIIIPTYDEQQAIGSYFSNLDNLINSHQEKISQIETLKKKLLQDMFI